MLRCAMSWNSTNYGYSFGFALQLTNYTEYIELLNLMQGACV